MWKRLALAAALAGCGSRSKLDAAADTDALWALAPDQTEIGVVVSGHGMGLALHGITAIKELANLPDFAGSRELIESALTAFVGLPGENPAEQGITTDRGFALFVTRDGLLAILPVTDRDKFVASVHGKRGSDADEVQGDSCKSLRGRYVCATSPAMFARLGKGSLSGKVAIAGGRGDIEVFAPGFRLLGGSGDLAIAAELERGTVSVRGRWDAAPADPVIGKLAGATAPKIDPTGTSGFAAFDISTLIAGAPPVPLAGGVTFAQLAASIAGPVSITVPAGTTGIQIRVPLKDPAPARTVIEHCSELSFITTTPAEAPGECRFTIQTASLLQLAARVEGNELRIAPATKETPPASASGPTAIGKELAAGTWTAVFWGRGSLLNLGSSQPASPQLPPDAAQGVHALSLIGEVGAGLKIEATRTTFRAYLRTAWANPPEIAAKLVELPAEVIASADATARGKAIAAAAPGSPFAEDFAAGQGGMIVPAAVIGLVASLIVPALTQEPDESPPSRGVDKAQLTTLLVRAYANEAYPTWQAANPKKTCPDSLAELAGFLGAPPDVPTLVDAWEHPIVMTCEHGKVVVFSTGPDGQAGTADDIKP